MWYHIPKACDMQWRTSASLLRPPTPWHMCSEFWYLCQIGQLLEWPGNTTAQHRVRKAEAMDSWLSYQSLGILHSKVLKWSWDYLGKKNTVKETPRRMHSFIWFFLVGHQENQNLQLQQTWPLMVSLDESSLVCWDPWSPAGGTIWEGSEVQPCRGGVSLGGELWGFQRLIPLPVSSGLVFVDRCERSAGFHLVIMDSNPLKP